MCFHVLVFLLASLLVLQPVVLNVLFAEQRAAFRAAAPSPDESFRDSPPPPLRLLSQATSGSTGTTQDTSKRTFADGFKAGKIAGKADADDAWFIGGFLFGILGVGAAALIKPGFSNLPQPYWSPDYIAAYEIGYISAKQRTNVTYAAVGWLASIPVVILIVSEGMRDK